MNTALSAIPDEKGGHQIMIRPDTYVEANLSTAYKGAPGAYNLLIGDTDGKLGSGATGRIIIDSGDPQKGFKSYDWWSTIRATSKGWRPEFTEQTFSSICWDRWILRNLYTSGGDAGFFWDLTDKSGEGFTVILEDCTLVHPDNALAMSYASNCVNVRAVGCHFIVLNFTQPEMGGKSTGIICTQGHKATGKLHVDLEDCILAGYSVFTSGEDGKAVSYTTKGKVQAYVQFSQPVPEGFERINQWPDQLFDYMAIPKPLLK